eukprot:TRINITY_DN8299_c0_g4_i1.p1 TRINITY_DN8299_c0_g4~~TRINITY_DN8299_c0_g4_i1.p1  ORF type:complete len:128 (+),score=12.63 TRINITY_DN8299_c0_g4_i1:220-603(+)
MVYSMKNKIKKINSQSPWRHRGLDKVKNSELKIVQMPFGCIRITVAVECGAVNFDLSFWCHCKATLANKLLIWILREVIFIQSLVLSLAMFVFEVEALLRKILSVFPSPKSPRISKNFKEKGFWHGG